MPARPDLPKLDVQPHADCRLSGDIDVELDTTEVNRGRDSQLDAALKSVMERLQSEKQITRKLAPAMPTQMGK